MQIIPLTKAYEKEWDAYVDAHPRGRIYHKIAWKKIIEQALGKPTLYHLAVKDGDIVGILPLVQFHTFLAGKQLISLPYVNYGGPLWSSDEVRDAFLNTLRSLLAKTESQAIEIRYDQENAFDLPVRTNKVTFYLKLPPTADELLKGFKAKLRSQIRRPTKEGMQAVVGHLNLLDDFYYVFCRNMRDLGTPVYDKNVFKTVLEQLPQQTRLVVVYTKDRLPVAAGFVMWYRNTMEIPWASSLRKYNRFSPNMLLYWQVLQLAIEQGCTVFDFGRGTKDGGTYRFKKQWGGDEIQLYWYYVLQPGEQLPEVSKENPKFELAIRVWRKLPLWFTNLMGPHIVKHIP